MAVNIILTYKLFFFKNDHIEITDISGRKVVTRIISNFIEVFELFNQSAGLYLVKTVIGKKEYIQKLLISKKE